MWVGELGAVWLRLGLTGAMRSRGPKPRYSPSAEDQRPQLGGELGPDLLQRQVDKVATNEGDCFFELSLDEVAAKIAAHMRRPEQEILQKAKLLEHCMQRAVQHSTREVVRRQLQRSMQGDGQQEDREDEDDDELESSDEDDGIQLVELGGRDDTVAIAYSDFLRRM